MTQEEEFDSFCLATQEGLLAQTFALTGDLPTAHITLRESYAAAWHHWSRVASLEDPARWVRRRAWKRAHRLARRRRSPPGREPLPEDQSGLIHALQALPVEQRACLILVELAGLHPAAAAVELKISPPESARLHRSATVALADTLRAAPDEARERLRALPQTVDQARLPRPSTLRRSGSSRRRNRTVAAVAVAAALALGSGALVYQPDQADAESSPASGSTSTQALAEQPEDELPTADDLLDEDQITRLGVEQPWRAVDTHDNTTGDGINAPCQDARFADPDGLSALVRRFAARGGPERSAAQTVEIAETTRSARLAYDTVVGWFAGCQVSRLQLLTSHRVDNVGDEARILLFKVWTRPVASHSVAVARVGRFVTWTVGETVGGEPAPLEEVAQSLADSVAMLCPSTGREDCSQSPRVVRVPPPRSGEELGLLAVADLPPVGRINEPWAGTDARPTRNNPAATICDRADFTGNGVRRSRTRTFLIPDANLPDRFGLSETYGEFRTAGAARRFVQRIESRVNRCEDRIPAARVSKAHTAHKPNSDGESLIWNVATEVSDDTTVLFRLGFVRIGNKVAQVNFSPAASQDMTTAQFDAVIIRAGGRLRELG